MVGDLEQSDIFRACIETAEELKQAVFVPYDTGNLCNNAIRYRIEGDTFHLWVDENIAPYMVFTNEEWISPKWRGKANPNEGWWQEWCETFMRRLEMRLKGDLKE